MQLYGILGINPSATEKEIRKSYHKLAKAYHPDKNNGDKTIEFQQINYAYNILINPKTREEYLKLNNHQEDSFIQYLFKVTKDNLTIEDLNELNIKIKDLVDITINKWNIVDVMKNFNFEELFNIFNNVKVKTKMLITETEEDYSNNILYFFNLPPKFLDYNKNNINLNFNITTLNILSNELKKIKIIRNINDVQLKENFKFEMNSPYIIFPNKGDNNEGHLIIQLKLPENIDWYEDMLIINYQISIHQYIYGLDVGIDLFEKKYEYSKWVPNRDGNLIILNTDADYELNIGIKFIIDYEHTDQKESILLNVFK
tara:strand:- start:20 stop:961 length:942 start_codon:yes stop_codon:yes gene_type:complete